MKGWVRFLMLLLIAGAAARIATAWLLQISTSVDHGIPCLMAKHMAEGTAWPAFYYGQPYMGSLEPFISSLFVRIMGPGGFAYNLGTALFAVLFLCVMAKWTWRAGGPVAACAALAFLVIGPPHYFQFSSWSYGGYAAILFLSPCLLLLSDRIMEKEQAERASGCDYLMLGILAGLGWWTSPLLVATFITVALMFVFSLRLRLFRGKWLLFLVAFFLAGIPFWIWNAGNGWITFQHFASKVGTVPFSDGIHRYIFDLLYRYLAIKHLGWVQVVYLILLAAFLYDTFNVARTGSNRIAIRCRSAAIIMQLVLPLLFCSSPYSADRYLTPLMGSFALIVGIGTAALVRLLPWKLGWIPLVALVLDQSTFMPVVWQWRVDGIKHDRNIRQMAAYMRSNQVDAVYCSYVNRYWGHGLNAHLDEEFVFSDPRYERIGSYALAAERADEIGVLAMHGNLRDFLLGCGGDATNVAAGNVTLTHRFQPPEPPAQPVPRDRVLSIHQDEIDHPLEELADLDIATARDLLASDGASVNLHIRLAEPRVLNGLRMYCSPGLYPAVSRISIGNEGDSTWHVVKSDLKPSGYAWSETRPFFRHGHTPWTLRFKPVISTALLLELKPRPGQSRITIQEVTLMEEADAMPDAKTALASLLTSVESNAIERLYASRWLANKVADKLPALATSQVPELFPGRTTLDPGIILTPNTGIAVIRTEAPNLRVMLAEYNITAQEIETGRWVLFRFPGISAHVENAINPGLFWTGEGVLKQSVRP